MNLQSFIRNCCSSSAGCYSWLRWMRTRSLGTLIIFFPRGLFQFLLPASAAMSCRFPFCKLRGWREADRSFFFFITLTYDGITCAAYIPSRVNSASLSCHVPSKEDKRSHRKELTMKFILFFTSSFISLERKIFTLQTSSLISTTHYSSCYSPQRTPPSTHDNIIEMHGTYSPVVGEEVGRDGGFIIIRGIVRWKFWRWKITVGIHLTAHGQRRHELMLTERRQEW